VYSHRGEIANILHLKKLKDDDFYFLITEFGLEYTKIGDTKRSNNYIVGKRIHSYDNTTVMKLVFTDNQMKFQYMNGTTPDIKLDKKEEMEINNKLLKLGFFSNADYYLVNTYKSNIINGGR